MKKRLKEQDRIFRPAILPMDEEDIAPMIIYRNNKLFEAQFEFIFYDGPDSPLNDWWEQVEREPVLLQPVVEPVLHPPEFDQFVNQLIAPQLEQQPEQQSVPALQTTSSSEDYEEASESQPQEFVTPPPPTLPPRRRTTSHGDSNAEGKNQSSRTSRHPVRSEQVSLQGGVVNLDCLRDLPPLLDQPVQARSQSLRRPERERKPPSYLSDYKL